MIERLARKQHQDSCGDGEKRPDEQRAVRLQLDHCPLKSRSVYGRSVLEETQLTGSTARPSLSHGHARHDDSPRNLAPVGIGIGAAVIDDAAGDHQHDAGSIRRHDFSSQSSRHRDQIDSLYRRGTATDGRTKTDR